MKENGGTTEISDEDIKAAFKELKTYVDISLDDFKEIYLHALKHAKDRFVNITVDSIMAKNIITVTGEADIEEAIHLISTNRIPCLPVIDKENRIIGMITRKDVIAAAGLSKDHTVRDIVRHIISVPAPRHHNEKDRTVKDIMSSPAITVRSGSGIKEAASKLIEMRINNLPVVDEAGKLIGIISAGDIVNNTGEMKL